MIFKRVFALILCRSTLFVTALKGFGQEDQPAKLTTEELE
jgi:hypothetical protein